MRPAFYLLFALTAACDRGPAVPSAAENADLDQAANQLDDASDRLNGIDDSAFHTPDTARAAPEGTAPPGQNDPDPSAGAR